MRNRSAVGCQERRAILRAAAGAIALAALPKALARPPLLTGTEMDAIALEFVPDATRLHPSLQPRYKPGSRCGECYFFQGRRQSDAAPCTVFAGYRVPSGGWCREFAPRT
jgi:hypothetical protein